jgi:hypothetical protein
MDNVLSFLQFTDASADPGLDQDPRDRLAESLAKSEATILQLRLERLNVVRTADFLAGLIVQKERAAQLLRSQIINCQPDSSLETLARF